MTSDRLKTLFHPFESGALAPPAAGDRVLFLGAEPGFRRPEGFAAEIACVQGFRPAYLALKKAGESVSALPEGEGYDAVLALVGRHRGQNELYIAEAIEQSRSGATIVVGGGKDDGIASLRRRFEGLAPVDGHAPKHHGIAFWFRRPPDAAAVAAILRAENPGMLVGDRFHTAPGMFSHDRADPGSRLLAAHLPEGIGGDVADFGAGWGYLAATVAERFPAVKSIDLYEADYASLEAARANMAALAPDMKAGFHWHDLLVEQVPRRYDCIVMNPPFHAGRAGDPGIGQGMIAAAAKALKPGGRLAMVANAHLPYEQALGAAFRDVRELVRDAGFKVLLARR